MLAYVYNVMVMVVEEGSGGGAPGGTQAASAPQGDCRDATRSTSRRKAILIWLIMRAERIRQWQL